MANRWWLTVIGAAALALAACSGDGGGPTPIPTPTGPPPDVCALITSQEIEGVLGSPITSTSPTVVDPFFGCSYSTEQREAVYITVYRDVQVELEEYYGVSLGASEEVDDLGEHARWGINQGTLEVLLSGYYLSITISTPDLDDAAQREAGVNLARTLIERLG